jgi:hypothetical protein
VNNAEDVRAALRDLFRSHLRPHVYLPALLVLIAAAPLGPFVKEILFVRLASGTCLRSFAPLLRTKRCFHGSSRRSVLMSAASSWVASTYLEIEKMWASPVPGSARTLARHDDVLVEFHQRAARLCCWSDSSCLKSRLCPL